MYIFLSHCVKDGNKEESSHIQLKRLLIEKLEAAGFGVFDYRERPGSAENWMKDIRDQIRISGCMIYFAKRWPEPDPGVCLIELGAAEIMEIPVYIYCPTGYQRGVPMFSAHWMRLDRAVRNPQDTVFSEADRLVSSLRSAERRREANFGLYQRLNDVFVRLSDPSGDPLVRTGKVFEAIRLAKRPANQEGLGMRRMKVNTTVRNVEGYWRIPSLHSVIVLRTAGEGRSTISHYVFSSNGWLNSGDIVVSVSPVQLLRHTYTIGPIFDDGRVCLLLHYPQQWRLVGFNLDITLQDVTSELARCIRRTCLNRFATGRCGLFADADFFELEVHADLKGRIRKLTEKPSVVPDEYYAPPLARAPRRLASIAGAEEFTTLIESGRAEAVVTEGIHGAVRQTGTELQLGIWEEFDMREILICLLRKEDSVGADQWANFARQSGLQLMPAAQANSPLEWYWKSFRDWLPDYVDGCTWFNNDYEEPRAFEPDISSSINLTGHQPPPRVVHCFDLKWTEVLRDKLWRVLQSS